LASVGRSGSTFLQRLLNTHPGIVLFGEHEGFIRGIQSAYAQLEAPRTVALLATGRSQLDAILKAEPVTDTPGGWSIEWTNALRRADVAPTFARFVKDLIYPPDVRSPSHRYWGFKEIRYGADELRFLGTVFPEARFVLLARDPLAVYRSQCRLEWGRQVGADQAAAEFHRDYSALADTWDSLREEGGTGGRARLVCYEQLAADPMGHLDLVARWLGIAPFDEEKVRAVAAAKLTPQRERWPASAEAFLDAYRASYAEADRRRYAAMQAGALTPRDGAVVARRKPAVAEQGQVASRTRPAKPAPKAAGQRKLVFLHLAMTGGTTLREQISTAFSPAEICPYRSGLPPDCSAEELDSYGFFAGRFTPDEIVRIPGEKYVFTVLREPRERLRSILRSVLHRPAPCSALPPQSGAAAPPPGAWMEADGDVLDNGMVRQLAGAVATADGYTYVRDEEGARIRVPRADLVPLALANLRRLDLIGFTDELDTVYARIAHEFGLSQASGALPRRGVHCATGAHDRLADRLTGLDAELGRFVELDAQVYAQARCWTTPLASLRMAPEVAMRWPAHRAVATHPGELAGTASAAAAG
jgi:hypothetical protein